MGTDRQKEEITPWAADVYHVKSRPRTVLAGIGKLKYPRLEGRGTPTIIGKEQRKEVVAVKSQKRTLRAMAGEIERS